MSENKREKERRRGKGEGEGEGRREGDDALAPVARRYAAAQRLMPVQREQHETFARRQSFHCRATREDSPLFRISVSLRCGNYRAPAREHSVSPRLIDDRDKREIQGLSIP